MSYDFNVIGLLKYFLFFPLLLIFASSPVSAQYDWTINNFDSQINLLSSGKVQIKETISVDFEIQKHGIFRDIPYIYTDENGAKTYTQIAVLGVERNNQSEKYKISKQGDSIDIKIGDPDKTISGAQTYTLNYEATGVLRSFDTYDELYWNVTGNYWEVPIKKASASVSLSEPLIEKTACYQGSLGSTESCNSQTQENTAIFQSTRALERGEGITLAVSYQKGLVPILRIEPPEPFVKQLQKPLAILAFVTTLIGGVWAIFYHWYSKGRDFWFRRKDLFYPNAKEEMMPIGANEVVVVEYSPPANLRPAEVGTLIDQTADTTDITATIVDLAVRDYMTITEKPKKWLFGKTDYILNRSHKSDKGLLSYESYLLNEIFSTPKSVTTSSLKKTFYDELTEVKKKLYIEVVEKKLFIKNPDTIRSIYIFIGIAILIAGAIPAIIGFAVNNGLISAFGAPIALNGILLIAMSNYMPRRTAHGHEIYRKLKGYELFVYKAESHRQKFFEDKNLFNEVLPYAITFGLVGKFAAAMKDIGLKPTAESTGWYTGTHPFSFDTFASNINGFSSSMSKAIASTPTSSGSGGGGFSGGGGGGGGGGSW